MALTYELLSAPVQASGRALILTTSVPSAQPQAIAVVVARQLSRADSVLKDDGVLPHITYGDRHLVSRAPTVAPFPSAITDGTGELGRVEVYVLDGEDGPLPATAQTVRIRFDSIVGGNYAASVIAFYGSPWVEVGYGERIHDTADGANPQVTITIPAEVVTLCFAALISGHNSLASLTPISGFSRAAGTSFGSSSMTNDVIVADAPSPGGNVTIGWTATSEDRGLVALALREVAAGMPAVGRVPVLATGAQHISNDPRQMAIPGTEGASSDPDLANGVWAPGDVVVVLAVNRTSATVPPVPPDPWVRAFSGTTAEGMGYALDHKVLVTGDTVTFDYTAVPAITTMFAAVLYGPSLPSVDPVGMTPGVASGPGGAADLIDIPPISTAGPSWIMAAWVKTSTGTSFIRWARPRGMVSYMSSSPEYGGFAFQPIVGTGYPGDTAIHEDTNTVRWLGLAIEIKQVVVLPPVITTVALSEGRAGVAYSFEVEAEEGAAPLVWSVVDGAMPPGILFSSGGVLSGTPTQGGVYTFTVQVEDDEERTDSVEFSLTVTAPVTVLADPLPTGSIDVEYTMALRVVGGLGSGYAWSLVAGALPTGMSLSATGALVGTPTESGAFGFTVEAESGGDTDTEVFTLTILAAVEIVTAGLPTGVLGQVYQAPLDAVGGDGVEVWEVKAGILPSGLSLIGASLEGVPGSTGSFPLTIKVTSGTGSVDEREFVLIIYGVLAITSQTLPDLFIRREYELTLAATGGDGDYVWSAVVDPPAGAVLAPDGVLIGLASLPGDFQFSVMVMSGDGQEDVAVLDVRVLDFDLEFISPGCWVNVAEASGVWEDLVSTGVWSDIDEEGDPSWRAQEASWRDGVPLLSFTVEGDYLTRWEESGGWSFLSEGERLIGVAEDCAGWYAEWDEGYIIGWGFAHE